MNTHTQLIHALLFTSGETWRFSELAETLQLKKDEVIAAVAELADTLQDQAIIPLVHEESITLVTRPELKDMLQSLEKEELAKEFSKGAVETLALIAYKGPIGKSDIDYIRGVNSQFMLRNLVMRGMIEKQPGGKGYCITADALRFLGVTAVDQLPQFAQFFTEIEKRIPTAEVPAE
jgi:segregation and condensation protein B